MAPPQSCFPVTLRFKNPQVEEGYLSGKQPSLARRVRLLGGFFLIFRAMALLFQVRQIHKGTHTEVTRLSYLVHVAVDGVIFLMDVVLVASTCLRQGRLWSQQRLEVAVVAMMLLSMAAFTLAAPTRLVKLWGFTLQDAMGSDAYDSDSTLLLVLDAFITVAHLGMPMRWCVVLPLEAAALLLYGINVGLIGSEEPDSNVFFNCLALSFLVISASVNKRQAEVDERRAFLGLISEKTLRYQAEWQLSQLHQEAATASAQEAGDASEKRSEPATDRSGHIFDLEGSCGPTGQLELLAAVGDAEHWRIPASELRLLKETALGSGSFGSVQRGVFCGMLVAVKCPHLEAMRANDLSNELRVLRHLRHPHIVTTHGAVLLPEAQTLYLVLELIDGVDLTTYLLQTAGHAPSPFGRYQVMLGVCRALLYMHTREPQIVHGDLKGSNIMVEMATGRPNSVCPKLLDFGLSRVVSKRSKTLGGTRSWMAPEIFDGAPVRCSADVFSFGHVLAFTATSIPPRRRLPWKRTAKPLWPPACAFAARGPLVAAVEACLRYHQELRPHASEVHDLLLALPSEMDLLGEDRGGHFLMTLKLLKEAVDAKNAEYLQQLELVARSVQPDQSFLLQHPRAPSIPRGAPKLPSLPEEEAAREAFCSTDSGGSPGTGEDATRADGAATSSQAKLRLSL